MIKFSSILVIVLLLFGCDNHRESLVGVAVDKHYYESYEITSVSFLYNASLKMMTPIYGPEIHYPERYTVSAYVKGRNQIMTRETTKEFYDKIELHKTIIKIQ